MARTNRFRGLPAGCWANSPNDSRVLWPLARLDVTRQVGVPQARSTSRDTRGPADVADRTGGCGRDIRRLDGRAVGRVGTARGRRARTPLRQRLLPGSNGIVDRCDETAVQRTAADRRCGWNPGGGVALGGRGPRARFDSVACAARGSVRVHWGPHLSLLPLLQHHSCVGATSRPGCLLLDSLLCCPSRRLRPPPAWWFSVSLSPPISLPASS